MLKYLVDNIGVDFVDGNVQTAAQFGNVETLELIHRSGHSLDVFDGTPLLSAVSNGHIDVVKYLLDNGVNVNVDLFNVLKIPCHKANGLEMVKLLVSYGVNVTRDNNDSIKLAGKSGKGDIVKFLSEQPGVVDGLSERDIKRNKLEKWL